MSDHSSPVMNIEDVFARPDCTDENPERGHYAARFALIGKALETANIGVNLTVVPAGKAAWPRHYHYVNDELFIVLAGTGTLHYGDTDYPLKPMDVINIRAGTGIPFQLDNTGEEELRYLALSTLIPADVFHYVDSDKIGVMAAGAPFRNLANSGGLPRFAKWVWAETKVGYWEGEDRAGDAGAITSPGRDAG
ncbi:MAG: cupin domain-containing protein [Pseudomonadota bacterium]